VRCPVLREQEFRQFDLARAVETLRRIKLAVPGPFSIFITNERTNLSSACCLSQVSVPRAFH
jgi:hypothetical protein